MQRPCPSFTATLIAMSIVANWEMNFSLWSMEWNSCKLLLRLKSPFLCQTKRELEYWRILRQVWGGKIGTKQQKIFNKSNQISTFFVCNRTVEGWALFLLLLASSCDYLKYSLSLPKSSNAMCICVCIWMSVHVRPCVTAPCVGQKYWFWLYQKIDATRGN